MPIARPRPAPHLAGVPDGWSSPPEGWTVDNVGRCRSCDAPVLWCFTPAGRKAPVNPDGTSHFATCPHAPAWRHGPGSQAVTRVDPEPNPAPRVSRHPGGSR